YNLSCSSLCFYHWVVQADRNGSGAYMHSGMRGDPHVGALRRCSFTNTESNSIAIHEHLPQALLLVKHTNKAHGDPLSVLPATAAFRVFQDRLLNKPHTLTNSGTNFLVGRFT